MMRIRALLVTIPMLVAAYAGQAQQSSEPVDNGGRALPLPTFSFNFGITGLMSDVALQPPGPTPFKQFGYQMTISERTVKFLDVSLDLYAGTVFGEEQRDTVNLNFRTALFSQHLNIAYNFYPLLKPDGQGRQLIQPYVGIGVGIISFRSKGDLRDSNNRAYHYWSDGSIMAEPEGSIGLTEATPLTRDFEYETDLRNANMDGLGKYGQIAFSLPINAGIRFQISKHVGVNAAFTYALNFTDLIDNVSPAGTGNRQGISGNDNHLYGSIGLSVFLGNARPRADAPRFEQEQASSISPGRQDRVPAEKEEPDLAENAVPAGTQPSKGRSEADSAQSEEPSNGKEDGRPDNKPDSKAEGGPDSGATNNQVGTDLQQDEPAEADSRGGQKEQPGITEPVQTPSVSDIQNAPPKESGDFHWADLNKDGWISPDEVLHFIDLLFDEGSTRTVTDIQNLIDYYFDQE